MSQSTNRLHQAFDAVAAAIAELRAAHEAIPDEEFTQDLPSVLVCSYEPLQNRAQFTLLGTVHHMAQTLHQAMAQPDNVPFLNAFAEALQQDEPTGGD